MNSLQSNRSLLQMGGLFIILLVAAHLRLGMVSNTVYEPLPRFVDLSLGMVSHTVYEPQLRNDAAQYYHYAINLRYNQTYSDQAPTLSDKVEFNGKPDAKRPPGYPLFILPFVKFPPDGPMVYNIQLAQVLVDLLTVLVVFFLARKALGYRAALAVASLTALSAHLVSMNIYVLTETLFTFTLVLYAYVTMMAARKPSALLWLLSGVLLGVTCLIKPTMKYFLVFAIVMLPFMLPGSRLIRAGLLLILGFALVMAPWYVRNNTVDAPTSTRFINHLQNGSYPDLMYENRPETRGIQHRHDPDYRSLQTLPAFLKDLQGKISEEPVTYLRWYMLDKLQVFFQWDTIAGMGDVYVYPIRYSPYYDRFEFKATHALMKAVHPLLMLSSLLFCVVLLIPGIRRQLSRDQLLMFIVGAGIVWYFVLVHWVGNPLPRYSIPLRPLQYLLAVGAAVYIYQAYVRHKHGEAIDTRSDSGAQP